MAIDRSPYRTFANARTKSNPIPCGLAPPRVKIYQKVSLKIVSRFWRRFAAYCQITRSLRDRASEPLRGSAVSVRFANGIVPRFTRQRFPLHGNLCRASRDAVLRAAWYNYYSECFALGFRGRFAALRFPCASRTGLCRASRGRNFRFAEIWKFRFAKFCRASRCGAQL